MKKRNIGIMAHVDAGKTTTTERILFYTGKIHRIGNVDTGNATMDWMSQEQERGITITAAATVCYWKDIQINIIDTPGHVDFIAEVERSLRILDGAIAVFSAVDGVEAQSETVWYQADKYGIPCLIFVNKMDRVGADFDFVVKDVQEKLRTVPVVLQLPIGSESRFEGIIDFITGEEIHWTQEDQGMTFTRIPIREEFKEKAREAYEHLLDIITQNSDELTEILLEGKLVSQDLLRSEIRRQTIERLISPVLLGSSLRNIGIQSLLDAVVDYLPSPIDLPPVLARTSENEERVLIGGLGGPLVAFVFKVQHDFQMGTVCFARIYQGEIKIGQRVFNTLKGRKEKISRLLRLHANHNEAIEKAQAGDILAIVGLKFTQTGDTLCEEGEDFILGDLIFPEPVISQSIEPKSTTDQDKLMEALDILAKEDPTFSFKESEETGQLLIYGMGELHLDVITHRLKEDYGVPIRISQPQVSYREKPTQSVTLKFDFNGIFVNKPAEAQLGISLSPNQKNEINSVSISDSLKEISGMTLAFLNALEKGVWGVLSSGVLMGYPVIETRITINHLKLGGGTTLSDSFLEMLASLATTKALRSSFCIRMQPIMKIEIRTPSEYMGDLMNQIIVKGGTIQGSESHGSQEVILAIAPLIKLFGYTTELRSLSKGRASSSMTFSHYGEE